MTDLFQQQGITFSSAPMASTHPTTTPDPIETPKIDMENAPGNQTAIAPVNASQLQPPAQDAQRQANGGEIPSPPDPQQISDALAGGGDAGSAATGAAPPPSPANSNAPVDLFQQEGVKSPSFSDANTNAFNQGAPLAEPKLDATTGVAVQSDFSAPANRGNALALTGSGNEGGAVAQVNQYVEHQQNQTQQLAQAIYTPEQLDALKAKGPIGFAEAFKQLSPIEYGLGSGADALKLAPIALKINQGQPLNPTEQQTITQYAQHLVELDQRGFSWGGKIAYVGAQIPSFAAQFLLSGGVGKIAESVVQKAAVVGTEQAVARAAIRLTTQFATIMPGQYAAKYAEQNLNDVMAVTDKGQMVLKQADESPAMASLMAFGHASADVVSQMLAPAIGKYAVGPIAGVAGKVLATPMTVAAKSLSPEVTDALYGAWKAVQPNATVSQMFTQMGWAGMVEQLGANRVNQILNSTVDFAGDKNMTFDKYVDALKNDAFPSKDQLFLEGGLLAIAGGVHASTNLAFNLMTRRGVPAPEAQNAVDNMSSLEKDQFVAQNMPIPKSETPTFNDQNSRSKNLVFNAEHMAAHLQTGGGDSITITGTEPHNQNPSIPPAQISAYKDGPNSYGIGKIQVLEGFKRNGVATDLMDRLYSELPDDATLRAGITTDDGKKFLKKYGLGSFDGSTLISKSEYMAKRGDFIGNPILHADSVLGSKATSQPPSAQLAAGQTNAVNAANPPLINANQSYFNKAWQAWRDVIKPGLYAETINDVQPIEDLSKKAIAKGAKIPEGQQSSMLTSFTKSTPEWIRRNWTTDTTSWDNDGNQVVTGKGLKAIYDDFDNQFLNHEPNMAARHADFNDYLIARTLMEDQQKGLSEVTPDQLKMVADTMTRLSGKYGQNMKWMDTFASELHDWDNRILHNLVTSGLKTQAWYDDTTSQRTHYSPLNRVVDEEYPQTISGAASGGLGKNVNPNNVGSLKQRTGGSDLAIKDTFQSRLKNSAVIMQRSALNKLRADIAKFASYYPEEVKLKPPGILRQEVQHSYDPKLRAKLEQLADFLGGQVKRQKEGEKVAQLKGNLGAYEPSTKTTYLKPGTTEGTLTHEIGHMLDYMFNLKRMFNKPGIKDELEKLAEDRLRTRISLERTPDGKTEFVEKFEQNPQHYIKYVKNPDEILANFFDAWVNSPEQVERMAPKAKEFFEKIVDKVPDLAALKQIEPSTQRAQETIARAVIDPRTPNDSLPVYLDGRRMNMELSPELQKAFSNMNPIQMGMVERFLGGIARGAKRVLQFGATSTPDFMLRHFYRAVFTSFLNAKGSDPIDFIQHVTVAMPKAIFAVMGKNELYKEWASSSGALNTFMDLGDKNIAKIANKMFSEGNIGSFINPVHWFKIAKEVSDYAPRIAVFEKAKARGASDLAAGLLSLDATGNYIRHGSLVKRINQYAPFFNDMVQGGDRFIRSIMRDPVAFSLRALATITIPQIAITGYYLFAADDKTRDEYLNLPEWRRGVSMNIKVGDTWIPLPRAFAPGYAFGAIPEKMMIWMYGGPHAPVLKNFWLRQMSEAATSISPVFDWTRAMNPIFKSVLEDMTNYSFFRQGPIFTGDLHKTAPANQYSDYTSETAKLLGKMFNFSPSQIDNTVYNMAGNTGKYALQLSDFVVNQERKMAGEQVNEKPNRDTDNPLYGGLIEQTPRGTNTSSYQEFREHLEDASQAKNQLKELQGKDHADFQQQNARTLGAYPPINAMNTMINKIQHQIRLISRNTNLSGYDKEAQINRLKDQETALIEGANQRYRSATGESHDTRQ